MVGVLYPSSCLPISGGVSLANPLAQPSPELRLPGAVLSPRNSGHVGANFSQLITSRCGQANTLERTLIRVHVLQVDQKSENIAELTAGIDAGRTVERWQMPKGAGPGDFVIWYAAGRQQYIALGRVDAIPTGVTEGHGPYRGPVAGMEWIEPVDRRKVIRDSRVDGGVESCQTVDDGLVVDFLESLGLSHLTPRLRRPQLCPSCHQVMPLTGVCDNCG